MQSQLQEAQNEHSSLQQQIADQQKELQDVQAQLRDTSESKGDAESKNFSLLMQVEDWRQKLKSEREEHAKDLSR